MGSAIFPASQGTRRAGTPLLTGLAKDLRFSSPARPYHLYLQIPDLLAQRVAVDAEQIGRANLIAARRRECRREQRVFDLPQDAVIEAGRRQAVAEAAEILVEVALDRGRQVLPGAAFIAETAGRRWQNSL